MTVEAEEGYLVATLEPPSAVFHSIHAHFLSASSHNLIISKTNRIEVYEISSNGLVAKLQISINGRVVSLEAVRSPKSRQDYLLVCTEKESYCILRYDMEQDCIVTCEKGDLNDPACRPIEKGQLVAVDEGSQVIAIHMVQGLIKLIPVDFGSGELRAKEPRNRRIDELQILDIKFLKDTDELTLAVLYQTVADTFRLRTLRLSLRGKDFEEGPWSFDDLDYGSHTLISVPTPKGGVLVIADESILYYNPVGKAQCALAMRPTRITCYCRVDENGYRYLLADAEGALYVLILFGSDKVVESLKLEYLGRTVIASCMTYLDNGFVFIGSQMGASQVIRLYPSRLLNGSFIEVVDTIQGAAPIVDFITVDLEKIGQSSIAACSGAFKEGGIRLMRKGTNILIASAVDVDEVIKSVFVLQKDFHELVLLSGLRGTHILKRSAGELEELSRHGNFDLAEPSLLVTLAGSYDLQITKTGLYLYDRRRQFVWRPQTGLNILFATGNHDYLILVTSDQTFHLFDFDRDPRQPKLSKNISRAKSVSAIALSTVGQSLLLFMAHWNEEGVSVYDLTNEGPIKLDFKASYQIRSLQVCSFEQTNYLLAGLGNGCIVHAEMTLRGRTLTLGAVHRAMIGTAPVRFHACATGTETLLLASSDRSFIIKPIRGRLTFSMTNIKNVHDVAGIERTKELLLIRDKDIAFGTVDDSSKCRLHHQVKNLGETVTRIAHVPSLSAYAVLSTDQKHAAETTTAKSTISLFDQDTLYETDKYGLPEHERAHSLMHTYLVAQNMEVLVVGTAVIKEAGVEPQEGRILTFSVSGDKKLHLLGQTKVPGCVYALAPIDGKLVASINGMTGLYRWSRPSDLPDRPFAWTHLHSHFGQVLGIKLDVSGGLVAVGDLMKSVFLLQLDGSGERLVEVARDYEPHWMTEVRFINHSRILGADNLGNLFVMTPKPEARLSGGQQSLQIQAAFHLGEIVNKIDAGTLARRMADHAELLSDPQLLGTTCGGIYQFGRLQPTHHRLLKAIENNVSALLNPVGGTTHSAWREMTTDLRKPTPPIEHFVDGDVVLKFLELSDDQQKMAIFGGEGCPALGVPATEVFHILEMLLESIQ